MEGYLGEKDVTQHYDHVRNPGYMSLKYIQMYGSIDGAHHKDWVMDQVARILNGAPVTVREASWSNGHTELRYNVGTSDAYDNYVIECKMGEDGDPEAYEYSIGIAP